MRRKSSLPLPRFVVAESVEEGDTIRVTWTVDDIEISRVATVGAIHADINGVKTFISPNGNQISIYSRHAKMGQRYTLLSEAPAPQPEPLFEMET